MHYHSDIVAFLWVGLAALLFLNLWRITAVHAAGKDGFIGKVGTAMGALVHFG